ncbi:hypothetical protein D9V37_13445 [Nocardioides mangrovicus]|uniref:Nucleotidyl transferase AbiEii/AbiGii toxin family protein n=1 Tax=Nocardioides mangrovicus TaxID=2478913 RepID=A0A3L8P2S9_9ACTN|nr:hypothetical protein [Nocardioides mangrovicus]RLV48728.1 hypothetical protein D9V37_13445 [Nocardioides mangrovicus]
MEIATPAGGWPAPWPHVAELAATIDREAWTLVGGLMVQLHSIHRGLGVVRPTNDVDVVVHVETGRGRPAAVATALESLGYRMLSRVDPRDNTAHRFVRPGGVAVDLVAEADTVEVLMADHPAPRVIETMRGRDMVRISGGTQALRRTVDAVLRIRAEDPTTVSVPGPFGAVILKAAAWASDSRDPRRHLQDAAVLLACIEDPIGEREAMSGSDHRRLRHLDAALRADRRSWSVLPDDARTDAEAALRILTG